MTKKERKAVYNLAKKLSNVLAHLKSVKKSRTWKYDQVSFNLLAAKDVNFCTLIKNLRILIKADEVFRKVTGQNRLDVPLTEEILIKMRRATR